MNEPDMNEDISRINRLLEEVSQLKSYSYENTLNLQVIYDELYAIIHLLYKENPNKWHGTLNGVDHTKRSQILIMNSKKSSQKIKNESFWKAHENIIYDLNEIKIGLISST